MIKRLKSLFKLHLPFYFIFLNWKSSWQWVILQQIFFLTLKELYSIMRFIVTQVLQNVQFLSLRNFWIMKKILLSNAQGKRMSPVARSTHSLVHSLQPSFVNYPHHFPVIIDWIMLFCQRPISSAVLWEGRPNMQLITLVLLSWKISSTLQVLNFHCS